MGEYLNGVKIGTCESMYYTTYKQLQKFNVPANEESLKSEYLKIDSGFRFRFPFPDEDQSPDAICTQDDFERGWLITIPRKLIEYPEHNRPFIRTDHLPNQKGFPIGFNVECPSQNGRKWHNEGLEQFEIVQQKYVLDPVLKRPMLHTVLRCPYCKMLFRLDLEEAERVVNELKSQIEKLKNEGCTEEAGFMLDICNSIYEGYLIGEEQKSS